MFRLRTGAVTLAAAALVSTGLASTAQAAPAPSSIATLPSYNTWIADVTPVAITAELYLQQRLPTSGKPAVVFDIDNTTLETSYHFDPWKIPAIQPILTVAKDAKARGAAIIFVTGRPAILDAVSRDNLAAVGYPVDGLYTTQVGDISDLQKYKTAKRAEIESQGYTIVANIGNSASDLAGGHAERTFKLPDYNGALN